MYFSPPDSRNSVDALPYSSTPCQLYNHYTTDEQLLHNHCKSDEQLLHNHCTISKQMLHKNCTYRANLHSEHTPREDSEIIQRETSQRDHSQKPLNETTQIHHPKIPLRKNTWGNTRESTIENTRENTWENTKENTMLIFQVLRNRVRLWNQPVQCGGCGTWLQHALGHSSCGGDITEAASGNEFSDEKGW